MISGASLGKKVDRWIDDWKMAFSGILLATKNWRFNLTVAISFLVFGFLLNFLASSTAALNLFWATDFSGKMSILGDNFLAIFGVGRNFWDWLLIFCITLLQSVLIGLVVFVWQKKHRSRRDRLASNIHNTDNVQSAGLVAGLAVLGSGCPTCGTTLLMPVLGTVFSSGGYALAGILSGALTVGAILLALFTLKRIGKDAYVMVRSEMFKQRHQEKEQNGRLSASE